MPEGGIPASVITDVLGTRADRILSRQHLDEHGSRVIERVAWSGTPGGAACVKYGSGPDLLREAAIYAGWLDPRLDPVPKFLGYRALPGDRHVLAVEWLDGRMPDFTLAADVDAVFGTLGEWQARWSAAIAAGWHQRRDWAEVAPPETLGAACARVASDVRGAAWYEDRLTAYLDTVDSQRSLCAALGGTALVEACVRIREAAARLAAMIASVPVTLDPGDLSALNALILPGSGTVRFFDFEYAGVAPVSQVFESLGEPWETVPCGELVERGLRVYAARWTAAGGVPLGLDELMAAQRCLRVFRKCFELDADLEQLAAPGGAPEVSAEVRGWALDVARDLPPVLHSALPYL